MHLIQSKNYRGLMAPNHGPCRYVPLRSVRQFSCSSLIDQSSPLLLESADISRPTGTCHHSEAAIVPKYRN